jgi:NAD(P)-dependent dehydrogenase (short-subunit alcohol dehydrogenase family)
MSGLDLAGKRVVVTGAAGGLGRAFALAFAREGAKVFAADINEAGANETADLIRAAGGKAHAAQADVTSRTATKGLAAAAALAMGGIDVLVNNAAIYAGLERKGFEQIDEAVWDRVMAVNVKGPWAMTSAVAPYMRKAGAGAVINVSSATVMSGSPQWLHYVSSKGAVIAMTRALARELGDDKITVNALAPGFTLTEASLGLIENAADYGVTRGAIKRAAGSDDMVGSALFLASPLATFITGQTIIIDGGRQFL